MQRWIFFAVTRLEIKKDKLENKMKESNLLVVISGVSDVGKSEVIKRLLNYTELNSQKLITVHQKPGK